MALCLCPRDGLWDLTGQVGAAVPWVTQEPCWTPGEPKLDPTDPKVGVAVVGDTAPGAPSVLPPPRAGTWGQGTIITCKATAQGCCEGPMG